MSGERYFCPLIKKEIEYGKCVDINYELEGFKKEEEIKIIMRSNKMTKEEMAEICRNCPHNPL